MSNGDISVGELTGAAFPIPLGAGGCAALTPGKSTAQGVGRAVIALARGFGVLAGADRHFAEAMTGAALSRLLCPGRIELTRGNPTETLGKRVDGTGGAGLPVLLLPITDKGTSERGYSWTPVAGPITGGAIGAVIHNAAF
ncbi:hypothetical protein [Streptomyces sp. SAS_270]|uniref:hypothetical protein n=1 Tax=Streptomyces sp. SAS_270 TaxID=3412748 RepID=UPI00403D4196